MAKSKQTINDIQKALLSSTRYIKEEDNLPKEDNHPKAGIAKTAKAEVNEQVKIDPIVMKKIKILASYLGETNDEMVNKALNHFLRLKSLQLDQAIQKLTEE